MPTDINITSKRMLEFIEFAVKNALPKGESEEAICDLIGYPYGNLRKVRTGHTNFTVKHIGALCEAFNVDVNWIFGLSNKMFREDKTQPLVTRLKADISALEIELNKLARTKLKGII